jgi:hypothetical protein
VSDPPTLGVSNFLLENVGPSPKLHPACIFNHLLRPLAVRSDKGHHILEFDEPGLMPEV